MFNPIRALDEKHNAKFIVYTKWRHGRHSNSKAQTTKRLASVALKVNSQLYEEALSQSLLKYCLIYTI